MNSNVKRLTTGAILVAFSIVLSFLTLYRMPYGGSITVLSMLPVCIYAYRYGIKWGLLGGFAFGAVQLLLDGVGRSAFAGMSIPDFLLMLFLDYLVAYTCLGLTALGRNRFKSDRAGIASGIAIAACLRLLSHALSGYILFSSYAEWFFSQEGFKLGAYVLDHISGQALYILYTFFYNASFLVPETVLTIIGAVLIVPVIQHYIKD